MTSIVLPLYSVMVATIFMLMIHLHLAQVRELTIRNTSLISIGAFLWPIALIGAFWLMYGRSDKRLDRLQQGLSEGKWRTMLGRDRTEYEIDGDAFAAYEDQALENQKRQQAATTRKQHNPKSKQHALAQ